MTDIPAATPGMLCRCRRHLRSPGKPVCWECIDETLHRDPPELQKNIARNRTFYTPDAASDTLRGQWVGRAHTTRFKEYPE